MVTAQTPAPHVGAYMTPSPSELSIFGGGEELDEALALAEAEADAARAAAAASSSDSSDAVQAQARAVAERRQLTRALLDALYLGASNFLLAYNTRAGVGVLLRVFRLLRRRDFGALTDLRQLLDEKHVSFRVDAVSFGLFLGGFTGGYRALKALLPVVLRRLAAAAHRPALPERQAEQLAALASGALAGCALVFVDAKKRRSFALYALTRALQCAYNAAKRHGLWHFWGSDWRFGDALLFAVSSAQVMYAYVMRPGTLPPEYLRFIQNTGPVQRETLTLVQQSNRGVPIDQALLWALIRRKGVRVSFPVPAGVGAGAIIPCGLVHCEAESCGLGALQCFRRAFAKTFPLYLSLFIAPSVVLGFKKFLGHPLRTLSRAVLGATRSNSFLASFVTAYLALICAHRKLFRGDHRFVYYLAGLGASSTILLEPKSRRSELALYVLPRAIDSLFMILRDRKIFTGFRHGEVALFAASMSVMMFCYEHEKEAVSPLMFGVMKRFLATSTDKKRAYLALLQQQKLAREAQPAPRVLTRV